MTMADISHNPSISEDLRQSIFAMLNGERIHTCIQCGTCNGICPFMPWMAFTPRKMVAALREGMFSEMLDDESAWLCVSCCACSSACPQEIPLTTALMTRTREELVLSGSIPSELQIALENTQRYGNPLGESPRKRGRWTKGLSPPVPTMARVGRPVDVLWFVGDYASFHPRVQATVTALAKILNALDVDFAILGREEVSDGDSQRLAGESGLFEMLAAKNGKAFAKYAFNEIITTDPHAFNALLNEYPRLGIDYPVRHYTQFLAEHLDRLKPLLKREINALVTYHDPCYLGRANNIYDEPRALLSAIPGVVLAEMSQNRADSLCCGGGGGGMWLDGFRWEKTNVRLSEWRVKEALQARPEKEFNSIIGFQPPRKARVQQVALPERRILAVACPYETPRFEDAAKNIPEASELQIRDIAELLAAALDDGRGNR